MTIIGYFYLSRFRDNPKFILQTTSNFHMRDQSQQYVS